MRSPIRNKRLTSEFGDRIHPVTGDHKLHNGADYVSDDANIYAPESGVVESVYYNSTGGNQIIIDHGLGLKTGYAHLKAVNVSSGQSVKQGQVIGQYGATGTVTGAHLHFTVKQGEKYLDPEHNISNFYDFQLMLIAGIITILGISLYKLIKK